MPLLPGRSARHGDRPSGLIINALKITRQAVEDVHIVAFWVGIAGVRKYFSLGHP